MPAFEAAGVKLYAVSYDDEPALRAFAEKERIPFPLLSDLGSRVIREYGILNDEVGEDDAFVYGIPFPGAYVCDEEGVVVAKFFHDTYKKRDSPETLLDAARGHIEIAEDAPQATCDDAEVHVTAAVHGGRGTIRQGIIRQLVIRFRLQGGLHLYGHPVPDGMSPLTISVAGPEGLRFGEPVYPPTRPLHLSGLDVELGVWDANFDVTIPLYPDARVASETRPLDRESIEFEVEVRYQACDDETCLLPRTERLRINAPLEVIDVPKLGLHMGHGQREGSYDAMPHMRRMVLRSLRRRPLGFLRFLVKNAKLGWAARRRQRDS